MVHDGLLLAKDPARIYTMARTYREFDYELRLGVDGVVLDMHFPLTYQLPFDKPQPLGIRAALNLEERDIPFVINAAWYHHGPDAEWIYQMACERKWPMIEAGAGEIKDWNRALKYIRERV